MAIVSIGKPKSLAASILPSGSLDITKLQSGSHSVNDELAEFVNGDARVATHYQGSKSGEITVETPQVSEVQKLAVGTKVTSLVLTLGAAREAGGVVTGGDVTVTMSKAVVAEIGEISASNENDAPLTQSVTFRLNRDEADSADPTITIAEVV